MSKAFIALFLVFVTVSAITKPLSGSNTDSSLQHPKQVSLSGLSGTKRQMADIHNKYGKFLESTAGRLGYQTKDCAAVLKVESGGNGFSSSGRMIIRFENHVFYREYTNRGKDANRVAIFNRHFRYSSGKTWTGHEYRLSSTGQWRSFHGNQDKEWEVLQFAQTLDDTAALLSASYGAPQVMGFNYKKVGYSSVQSLFVSLSGSISKQMDALFAFIENSSKCHKALLANPADYVSFASCYNGAGQAAHYGSLIQSAATAYSQVTSGSSSGGSTTPTPPNIYVGDTVEFTATVNLRTGAGTGYSVVSKSNSGLQGQVIGGPLYASGYHWYQIKFPTYTAWAAYKSTWYKVVSSSNSALKYGDMVVFKDTINLRSGPGTSNSVVTSSYPGLTGTIIGGPSMNGSTTWYQIKLFDGQKVWAAYKTQWYGKANGLKLMSPIYSASA